MGEAAITEASSPALVEHVMARITLALALLILAAAALPPAGARGAPPGEEIESLLDFVEASGCGFVRNGTAHDAADGRRHLERKLAYLRERGRAGTAEDFIEQAATRSSTSGRAYSVRCSGAAEQPSGAWLRAELARLRAADESAAAAARTPADRRTPADAQSNP